MLLLNTEVLKLPVVSLQTGQDLARLAKPIIDPRQLQVVAFYCDGPGLDDHPSVLHSQDIREVSAIGLIIDSSDDIMSPTDLVRLQQVLQFDFTLEGKLVIDDLGGKVGKVRDFAIEMSGFHVMKLHIKAPWVQAWHTTERIVDRSQIIEITDQHIVVKSATIKAKQAAKPVFTNPFKATHPQPDGAHRQETS